MKNKVDIIMNAKVIEISYESESKKEISLKYKQYPNNNNECEIKCDFLINAAGGSALNLAKMMKLDLGFKKSSFSR